MKRIVILTMKRTVITLKKCMKKVKARMMEMRWKKKMILILKKLISSSSMRKKERSRKIFGFSIIQLGLKNKRRKLKIVTRFKRKELKRNKEKRSMLTLSRQLRAQKWEKRLTLKN